MRYSILVIENGSEISTFLKHSLGVSFHVSCVKNEEMARLFVQDHRINLIVCEKDIRPENGFDLCSKFKADVDYCHIPFVILSDKNTHSSFVKGLKSGADAFIAKPWIAEVISLQIANLIKNQQRINAHFADAPLREATVLACSKTDEAFMRKLENYILKNIRNTHLNTSRMAEDMNMSRASFYRKVKSLSTLTPKDLVDKIRLNKAIKLITTNEFPIDEIARLSGFNSQSSFHRNFQKHLKTTPTALMNKLIRKKPFRSDQTLNHLHTGEHHVD